jgi:sulfite reductase alpha subunit-like flavoprotein
MGDTTPKALERSVIILYGSETGNAQEVAEELGSMAERLRFTTHVSELNQCKPVCPCLLDAIAQCNISDRIQALLSSYTLTIFVASTTGQGDLPANARSFWKSLLLKKLSSTFLAGTNFACFGLGDSSYPKYAAEYPFLSSNS